MRKILCLQVSRSQGILSIPDPADRRAKLICYTDRGWAAHNRGGEIVMDVQREWAERLGSAKLDQLLALLRELHDSLQAQPARLDEGD